MCALGPWANRQLSISPRLQAAAGGRLGREHTCTCTHVTPSLQIKNQDFKQANPGDEDICERHGGRAVEADAPHLLGGVDVDDDVGLPSLLGRTGKARASTCPPLPRQQRTWACKVAASEAGGAAARDA